VLLLPHAGTKTQPKRMHARDMPEANLLMNPSTRG
jgi:hypothetical protein